MDEILIDPPSGMAMRRTFIESALACLHPR
jgi:hypothetical protein